MNYHGYEIEKKFILDEETIAWGVGKDTEFAIGSKDGKRFFIGRNDTVLLPDEKKLRLIFPDEGMVQKRVEMLSKPFEEAKARALAVKESFEGIDCSESHIAAPIDVFVDNENHLVAVSPFVENAVRAVEMKNKLNEQEFAELAMKMIAIVKTLGEHKLVLGNINPDKFIFAEEKTPYLVGVEGAYPVELQADFDSLSRDVSYSAPELMGHISALRPEHDLYSLALVLHWLYTGKRPVSESGKVGADFIDKKFDFKVPGEECLFSEMLAKMLNR